MKGHNHINPLQINWPTRSHTKNFHWRNTYVFLLFFCRLYLSRRQTFATQLIYSKHIKCITYLVIQLILYPANYLLIQWIYALKKTEQKKKNQTKFYWPNNNNGKIILFSQYTVEKSNCIESMRLNIFFSLFFSSFYSLCVRLIWRVWCT